MSIWTDKSIPRQILYPSSVSWKIIRMYLFSSNIMYFAQKEPIKMKMFQTFKCSGQIFSNSLCKFWNESIPLQILYPSSFSWKITPLYFFLAQTLYALLERSLLEWKFWRLTSAQVKICKISYVNFETASGFLSKFCIPLHFHERLFLCTFFSSNNIFFAQKEPIKMKIF